MESEFAYCVCQAGAEPALKQEVAARLPAWRFAFSRPGFVTFKLPLPTTAERFEPTRLTFARAIGLSLGRVDLPDATPPALAAAVWETDATKSLTNGCGPLALHAFSRHEKLPGDDGAEPGPTADSIAAAAALRAAAPAGALSGHPNEPNEPGGSEQPNEPADAKAGENGRKPAKVALDVVLVEPRQWWIGAHSLRSRVDRWPGGAPRLTLPEHAVSRAYLKMQEALRWSAAPTLKGEVWVELGCAPGGASQALLDAGMRVVGVDPADVDPIVAANPMFEHLRARAAEIGVDEVTDAAWITADINVAPQYTLDSVERLVAHPSIRVRGVLLTLKLLSLNLARPEVVAETIERVRSWGLADVRTRQLAHNRREYCLAAMRTRGQRRVRRKR